MYLDAVECQSWSVYQLNSDDYLDTHKFSDCSQRYKTPALLTFGAVAGRWHVCQPPTEIFKSCLRFSGVSPAKETAQSQAPVAQPRKVCTVRSQEHRDLELAMTCMISGS
jgi:hypothetical protein